MFLDKHCLFCKIINKELKSSVIAENDHTITIKDIAPKAPIHYLILPKKHIVHLALLEESDFEYATEMLKTAQKLAKMLGNNCSFNLVSNNGKEAGQSVLHWHWHFLSGKNLYKESGFSL